MRKRIEKERRYRRNQNKDLANREEKNRNKRNDNNIGRNVKTKRVDEGKRKTRQNYNFSSVIYSVKWSGKRKSKSEAILVVFFFLHFIYSLKCVGVFAYLIDYLFFVNICLYFFRFLGFFDFAILEK